MILDASGERPVETDGDFRSETNRAILTNSDIVVTNPPFSMFREYMTVLMEWGGKFCVIGNTNTLSLRWAFSIIENEKMWLGSTFGARIYDTPNGKEKQMGNTAWFTNMDHKKRHDPLVLREKFNPKNFPRYDNYDAIEVPKVAKIPADYADVMGVPITYLQKHCPEQFEIVGLANPVVPMVNGSPTYRRILIRNRNPESARKVA